MGKYHMMKLKSNTFSNSYVCLNVMKLIIKL